MYNGKVFQVGAPSAVLAFKGGVLQWKGRTLKAMSENISTDALKITGGVGNVTQMIYNHTAALTLEITDVQYQQELTSLNMGTNIIGGGDTINDESVVITNNSGTIIGDPLKISDAITTYVYYSYNGVDYSVPVTNKTFATTGIPNDTTLCVSYLTHNANAKTLTINANLVPDVVSLYVITNLSGTDTATKGFIGRDVHYIPLFKMSGNQTIDLAADGYTETTISGEALVYEDNSISGCANNTFYAKISREMFNSNWYDNVSGLAIEDGDFDLTTTVPTNSKKLKVWYVSNGVASVAPNSDLTFESNTESSASVSTTGVVTAVATGTSLITVKIIAKPTIEANATVTVS